MNDRQVYSDLGFMVLSWIIERTGGRRLDEFVYEQIYSPLGIEDLFFLPLGPDTRRLDSCREKLAATQDCPWRKRVLKGEVDDDNAWAAGGIEGHAGLFGTAEAVHDLCLEIMNAVQNKSTNVLSSDIIRNLASGKNQFEMTAGFDTPAKKNSSSGRYFSASSLGHLGFTGTSFWMDPKNSFLVVFLTNRVHPLRSNMGIKEFRPRLHDLLVTHLL
jgi:CubicO group peptidase (beta-lactamase class C family)